MGSKNVSCVIQDFVFLCRKMDSGIFSTYIIRFRLRVRFVPSTTTPIDMNRTNLLHIS